MTKAVVPVTMVVTSCQRYDMLERTLDTFFAVNDYPLARVLVIEDSDDHGIYKVTNKFGKIGIEVILNGVRLKQHPSIDKAYSTVTTDYIFHCEDDYEFGRGGIVRESVEILEADPSIVMVLPRDRHELPYYLNSVPVREVNGARYRKVGPSFHHKWYTWSFNPGLRRTADFRALPGGYSQRTEEQISRYYKAQGRAMAILVDGQARHLGRETPAIRKKKYRRGFPEHVENTRRSLHRRARHYLRMIGIGDGSA